MFKKSAELLGRLRLRWYERNQGTGSAKMGDCPPKKAGPRMSVAPPLSQGTGSVVCGAPVPNDYGATVTLKLLIVPGPVTSVTFTANVLVVPAWVSPGVQVTLPVNGLMAIGTCDVPVGVKTRE